MGNSYYMTKNNDDVSNYGASMHLLEIKELIKQGANPDIQDVNRATLLMWAFDNERFEIVRFLLEHHADTNITDNRGDTALMHWLNDDRATLNITKLLLSHGTNPNIPNLRGHTPLLIAVDKGHSGSIKLLLKRGANPNAQSYSHKVTPLMIIATKPWPQVGPYIAQLLLENGANASIRNSQGLTALDIAREHGNQKIIELLTNPKYLKHKLP